MQEATAEQAHPDSGCWCGQDRIFSGHHTDREVTGHCYLSSQPAVSMGTLLLFLLSFVCLLSLLQTECLTLPAANLFGPSPVGQTICFAHQCAAAGRLPSYHSLSFTHPPAWSQNHTQSYLGFLWNTSLPVTLHTLC